jgi:hypothetical protein
MEYDTEMINRDTFYIFQINKQGIYRCNSQCQIQRKKEKKDEENDKRRISTEV